MGIFLIESSYRYEYLVEIWLLNFSFSPLFRATLKFWLPIKKSLIRCPGYPGPLMDKPPEPRRSFESAHAESTSSPTVSAALLFCCRISTKWPFSSPKATELSLVRVLSSALRAQLCLIKKLTKPWSDSQVTQRFRQPTTSKIWCGPLCTTLIWFLFVIAQNSPISVTVKLGWASEVGPSYFFYFLSTNIFSIIPA
jgi:hypothetical protein